MDRSVADVLVMCQQKYVFSVVFTVKQKEMPGYEISDQR